MLVWDTSRFNTLFILFVVYLTTLFSNEDYLASNEKVISELWIENDLEGSGHGLMLKTTPEFVCRKWEK
jgi:hypothetical protein